MAGGKSSRLGREKALERIGNKRIIERVVDSISPISQEVLVVTSKERFDAVASVKLKAKVVVDIYPDKAAFGGIYTGLANASTPYGLVVACDMPFLNGALLRYLVQLASGFDIVIPKVEGKVEPLHAIYSKDCLAIIKKLLDKGILQPLQLLDMVKTRFVGQEEVDRFDPAHLSFFNINTQKDVVEAGRLLECKERSAVVGKVEEHHD